MSWEILERAIECCECKVECGGRKQGSRWKQKRKQRSGEKTSRKLKEYPEGAIFRILILPLDLLTDRDGEFKTGSEFMFV